MCSACHSASADSRVAIVSRRGAEVMGMGLDRNGRDVESAMRGSAIADAARRTTLRRILACALAGAGAAAVAVAAQNKPHAFNLPLAQDLAADAAASARERIPILIFFDRAGCPYCERALREYAVPMSNEAPWRDRAIFRQIEVDEALPLTDFDGSVTTHAMFASRYRASLTPTVQVVDARGTPIGGALIGLTPAFYGAYLENAIDAGVRTMRPE